MFDCEGFVELAKERLFFMFYDMYMGEVGMADSCSCIDDFKMFRGTGQSISFGNFLFN
jgi:hypothetical protein